MGHTEEIIISGKNGEGSGPDISGGETGGRGRRAKGSSTTVRTAGTETGTETRRAETKEQGIPGLAVLEVPSPVEGPAKKKKTRQSKDTKELADNLQVLIKSGFDMLALRIGEIWILSDKEANDMAQPLARIIERHNLTKQINEGSDYVALTMAVTMSILPRFLLYQQARKEVKNDSKGPVHKAHKSNDGESRPPSSSSNNVKELLPGLA